MGTPDESVQIGDSVRPAQRSTMPAKVKRWRWSFGVGPYSLCRSLGSSGPAANGIWSSFA